MLRGLKKDGSMFQALETLPIYSYFTCPLIPDSLMTASKVFPLEML